MLRLRVVLAVGFAIASALACGSGDAAGPGDPPPVPVKVLTVVPEPRTDTVRGVGAVEAAHTAELRPEASGTVAWLGFDDGVEVKRGDVLLRLRQDAERARLDEASARVTLATTRESRARRLFDRGEISRADLDDAVAELALAEAARDLAGDGLRRTEVRAPFDGTTGRREVSIGAAVGPQTTITRIDDLSELFVESAFPERDLFVIREGAAATVRLDALPDVTFDGTVRYVAPRVDAATRTLPVRVALPPDDRLRPGLVAEVEIVVGERAAAVLVPTQAIVPGAERPAVWTIDAQGKAGRVPVTTGVRDADRIEVLEGLAPGDRVIVEGLSKLRPGAPVQVLDGEGS